MLLHVICDSKYFGIQFYFILIEPNLTKVRIVGIVTK